VPANERESSIDLLPSLTPLLLWSRGDDGGLSPPRSRRKHWPHRRPTTIAT